MLMTLGAFSAAFSGAIGTLASALLLALGAVDLPKMLDTLPATCSAKLFRGSTLGFGAAMVLIGAFGGMAFATLATGIAGAFLVTGATVCVAAPAISVTLMMGVLETDPAMVFGIGTTGTTSATLLVGVLDTDTDPVDPVAVCVACVVKATWPRGASTKTPEDNNAAETSNFAEALAASSGVGPKPLVTAVYTGSTGSPGVLGEEKTTCKAKKQVEWQGAWSIEQGAWSIEQDQS